MNIFANVNTFKHVSLLRPHIKCAQSVFYSAAPPQPAVKEKPQLTTDESFESLIHMVSRTRKPKQPKREPFIKNLIIGKYDRDVLTYPEIDKEELEELTKNVEPVKRYFSQVGPEDTYRKLSEELVEIMGSMKLFGLQVPRNSGGLELTLTEQCRYLEEITSCTAVAPSLLQNEYFGIQLMRKYGSDEQKAKYLPDMLSGKILSATCISEALDDFMSQTTASFDRHQKEWVLNGDKATVVNGSKASLYFVYARTSAGRGPTDFHNHKYSIFLVEKGSSGVTDSGANGITTYACNPMGVDGTDVANVKFENTVVPESNVIGLRDQAQKTISSLLLNYRLSTGCATMSILKSLKEKFAAHIKSIGVDAPLAKTDLVKHIVAKNAMSLYALESMVYLTAGLSDTYEDQDCEVEAAVCKAFACNQYNICFPQTMNFLGHSSYMMDHWCNKLYRDGLSYCMLDESLYSLKIEITMKCLMHIGDLVKSGVKMSRNPLLNPLHGLKMLYENHKHQKDDPKRIHNLKEYLHPSLQSMSDEFLEYSVLRLHYATQTMLVRHGREVVNRHLDLIRLADIIIDVYAMTASIARASRSYCIGLQDSHNEHMMAGAFAFHATKRVRANVEAIVNSPFGNTDKTFNTTAQRIFEIGDCFPEHPLSRSY